MTSCAEKNNLRDIEGGIVTFFLSAIGNIHTHTYEFYALLLYKKEGNTENEFNVFSLFLFLFKFSVKVVLVHTAYIYI